MSRRWWLLAATIGCGCLAVACGSNSSTGQPTPPSAAPSETRSFTLDDQLDWVVASLDAGRFDPDEAAGRFEPGFLAEVPIDGGLGQVSAAGSAPWQIVSNQSDGQFAEVTLVSATGGRLALSLAISDDEPHLIEGLALQPAPVQLPEGYTFDDLDADLTAFAPAAAVGVYDVTDGSCVTLHELEAHRTMAVGSVFKLWVLAELAHQVDAGTATWDEPLEVRRELRSNPVGQVFQLEDGQTLTLREYAEAMISISDNTATDHLIDRLGRGAVEAAMTRAGVGDPSLNQPLLATRELFWLKFAAQPPNPDTWATAGPDERRAILDSLDGIAAPWIVDPALATAAYAEGLPTSEPRNLEIEYFASPRDVCRTLVHLDQLAQRPGLEPVAGVLSIHPGTSLDPTVWPEIRFKGGSEPGVHALAWWLRRSDNRSFVVVGAVNNPDEAFDHLRAGEIVSYALALI